MADKKGRQKSKKNNNSTVPLAKISTTYHEAAKFTEKEFDIDELRRKIKTAKEKIRKIDEEVRNFHMGIKPFTES